MATSTTGAEPMSKKQRKSNKNKQEATPSSGHPGGIGSDTQPTRIPKSVGKTDGFESNELARLFNVIDKMRECGVSEDISLPQVCSVLEFPSQCFLYDS